MLIGENHPGSTPVHNSINHSGSDEGIIRHSVIQVIKVLQGNTEIHMIAMEMTGTVDENSQLQLDGSLPFSGLQRVRVIVLSPPGKEIDKTSWLQTVSRNPAFAFLTDPEKDIYSITGGQPGQSHSIIFALMMSAAAQSNLTCLLSLLNYSQNKNPSDNPTYNNAKILQN